MSSDTRKAYLVESIPTGMEQLKETRGVEYTGPLLTRLVNEAQETIDITAMYWALTANPKRGDENGFTVQDLLVRFGAAEGQALFEALCQAAQRGIRIRIVQSPGFDSAVNESADLQQAGPDNVQIRQIDLNDWFASGIMHQKIWVFDNQHVYLGSANNDWKSLTQVKEIGVGLENDPAVAAEMTRYFDTWWELCGLQPDVCRDVPDPEAGIRRQFPAWSDAVPADQRQENPLDKPELRSPYDWDTPMPFGDGSQMILSAAPREVCVGNRTFDGDILVKTIREAENSVCICVMDFAPVSLYRGRRDDETQVNMDGDRPASPVWWPALFDALVYAVTTKRVHARLFVSQWAHTSDFLTPYLRALQATADAGQADQHMRTGLLEIKRFVIPGWDATEPWSYTGNYGTGTVSRTYPGHTRVNHTKYIVTDKRINIGTSNMTWDYFAATAGASFNTNHPALLAKLQEIFDRDWTSSYAVPLA